MLSALIYHEAEAQPFIDLQIKINLFDWVSINAFGVQFMDWGWSDSITKSKNVITNYDLTVPIVNHLVYVVPKWNVGVLGLFCAHCLG